MIFKELREKFYFSQDFISGSITASRVISGIVRNNLEHIRLHKGLSETHSEIDGNISLYNISEG